MAGENLASVNSALSTFFAPDLYKQWNRTALLTSMLAARQATSAGGGKSVNFVVEFSGNQAATVAEGSDVASTEFASDENVPAVLPWAHYRTAFQISETEYAAALSSGGTPDALRRLFDDRVMGGGARLMNTIERDLLIGTGVDSLGNPTLVGLYNGALVNSGSYAGISTASYPEWASNILGNGGVGRALTSDLLAQADAEIFAGSSEPWNLAMTTAQITRKFEGLFTSATVPMIRMNDNPSDPKYGLGNALDPQAQPTGLYYKGQPLIRNQMNPAGKLLLLNTRKIEIKYLPHPISPDDAAYSQIVEGEGSNGFGTIQATKIPIRIAMLAKTGESYKVMMTVTLQSCVTRPNASALISDVLES